MDLGVRVDLECITMLQFVRYIFFKKESQIQTSVWNVWKCYLDFFLSSFVYRYLAFNVLYPFKGLIKSIEETGGTQTVVE